MKIKNFEYFMCSQLLEPKKYCWATKIVILESSAGNYWWIYCV